jgi:hypothetical protein
MRWRNSKATSALREQINALSPNRSKASDGTIGDSAHASRSSDHNPWVIIIEGGKKIGIVTAVDITHDPVHGIDARQLAEAILRSRDPRIKYVISNGEICSGFGGPFPWQWRRYDGVNPHTKHVHLSVEDTQVLFDDPRPWDLDFEVSEGSKANPVVENRNPLLKKGSKGEAVKRLQTALNRHGASLKVDGDFGKATDKAVRLFQRANGLHVDGKVGQYTWDKLEP